MFFMTPRVELFVFDEEFFFFLSPEKSLLGYCSGDSRRWRRTSYLSHKPDFEPGEELSTWSS